jgi:hypothetical protein
MPNTGYSCLTKIKYNGELFYEFCSYFLPVSGAQGFIVIFDTEYPGWDFRDLDYSVQHGEIFVSGHPEFQYIFSGVLDLDAIAERAPTRNH